MKLKEFERPEFGANLHDGLSPALPIEEKQTDRSQREWHIWKFEIRPSRKKITKKSNNK